jgi:hypothetical protein
LPKEATTTKRGAGEYALAYTGELPFLYVIILWIMMSTTLQRTSRGFSVFKLIIIGFGVLELNKTCRRFAPAHLRNLPDGSGLKNINVENQAHTCGVHKMQTE